jgi:hypothetical protein
LAVITWNEPGSVPPTPSVGKSTAPAHAMRTQQEHLLYNKAKQRLLKHENPTKIHNVLVQALATAAVALCAFFDFNWREHIIRNRVQIDSIV